MSTIRIKRSGTSGAPSNLQQGELAYSYLEYNPTTGQGGDKLYIGEGPVDANSHAENVTVIGGKYFTDKMDHAPGTLTANSAIITDNNNRINEIKLGDITNNLVINGNSVTASAGISITVGNTAVDTIDVNNARIVNVEDPLNGQDAATKSYVDTRTFTVTGDGGNTSIITIGDTLDIAGGTGISTSVNAIDQLEVKLDDTTVVASTYGSSTAIPVITVDPQGRLTGVTTAAVGTQLSIQDDTSPTPGTDTVDLLTDTLTFASNNGVVTTVTNNQVEISLTQDLDSAANVAFAQITVANSIVISEDSLVQQDNSSTNPLNLFATSNTINIGSTDSDVNFGNNVEIGGDTLIVGDLIVQGNTTTIATETLVVEDNIIFLNANNNTTEVDLGWVGLYNESEDANTAQAFYAGFFRDTTDNRFKAFDSLSVSPGAFVDTGASNGFSLADIQAANFHGELQGNANTASALDHNVTINLAGDIAGNTTVDFSGTSFTINAFVQPDSVALGTDTTGDYAATVAAANPSPIDVTATNAQTEGATYEVDVAIAQALDSDTVTPTKDQLGVATFDSTNFDVTAQGMVTIDTVDGGTY